jgi:hypothetical protein
MRNLPEYLTHPRGSKIADLEFVRGGYTIRMRNLMNGYVQFEIQTPQDGGSGFTCLRTDLVANITTICNYYGITPHLQALKDAWAVEDAKDP